MGANTQWELTGQLMEFYERDEQDGTVSHLNTALGEFSTTYIFDSPEFIVRDYAYTYADDITLSYQTATKNYIQIAFFLNDELLIDRINGQQNIYRPQHNYIYFTPCGSEVDIYFKKGVVYRNLDIYVESDYFHEFAAQIPALGSFISAVDSNAFVRLAEQGIPISPQMQLILKEMKACDKKGLQRLYFMKSRILNLLQLLFEWIDLHGNTDAPTCAFKETPTGIYHDVQEFIVNNTSQFYTIEQLSALFGINEYKLKKGFKASFGMGLFQFATKVHIQEARSLLKTTNLSIKEIAFRTGYSSPSSFSVAFKKHCGISPNRIRRDQASS
ncbi:helix-turn-helix domain-containing protein [Sphingobacterium thalpophilum]|uniref:helix-turn-helix domain-containing protein n=1 Tax=Sphingobacterium thalpophilum TaxID=259 RepID=UPI003C732F7D